MREHDFQQLRKVRFLIHSSFARRFALNLLTVHKDCETKIDVFSDLKIYQLKIKLFIISCNKPFGSFSERDQIPQDR